MKNEDLDVLKAEYLYYTLRHNKSLGKQLFFDLVEDRSDSLDKLLSGEMEPYVLEYDDDERVEIYEQLAQLENRLEHTNQAKAYYQEILALGEQNREYDWQLNAYFGLHNSTWQYDAQTSLQSYLKPALEISEKYREKRLPQAQYEMGFVYRQMQNIDKAIEWYRQALESAINNEAGKPRKATILNDLGFAYTHNGEYKIAEININAALQLRQQHLEEIQQQIEDINSQLKSLKEPKQKDELHYQLTRLELKESDAKWRVGMAFNTMGEISRYQGKLEKAVYYYSEALDIFEEVDQYRWQAKALVARGEARRRMALESEKWHAPTASKRYQKESLDDLEKGLYLCEKFRLVDERDTANRRMGRWLHDSASRLKSEDKDLAVKLLNEARRYFEQGLKFAKDSEDVLEELENLTEIAFLVDDLVEVAGISSELQIEEYQEDIKQLSDTLEKYRNDSTRIYQFEVFENLLRLEKGAFAFVQGKYDESLQFYLEGYKGLASDLGYGSARYQVHFGHLTGQIERLPDIELAKSWCDKFIEVWRNTTVNGSSQTLAQIHPDLVEWCRVYLLTRG